MGVEDVWRRSNHSPLQFKGSVLAGHIIMKLISTFQMLGNLIISAAHVTQERQLNTV